MPELISCWAFSPGFQPLSAALTQHGPVLVATEGRRAGRARGGQRAARRGTRAELTGGPPEQGLEGQVTGSLQESSLGPSQEALNRALGTPRSGHHACV